MNAERQYRTDEQRRSLSTSRRVKLRLAKICINASLTGGPSRWTRRIHGPPNPSSGKCAACEEVARRTR
jgi:hypothetical protein